MNKSIDFAKPYINQDIIDSVVNSLKSGWITTGPKVAELENKICELFNVEKCLCLNSWTNAAFTVLKWYGIQENDQVIVPVTTFCATANIVLHCKATIIMVDIGDNMNINVEKIKENINENTKAIIPVDIGGFPCDYDKIMELVNDNSKFRPRTKNQKKLNRILVMSDAAHSIGAKYKGSFACNYPDISIFSFHAAKNITTAEGGAICFNLPPPFDNQQVCHYLKMFTLHGQDKSAIERKAQSNGWEYDILEPGYKFNLPDILACIGLEQLKKFDFISNKRKALCREYYNNLVNCKFIEFPIKFSDIENSSCHLFCIRIKGVDKTVRDKIINDLSTIGIKANVHFKPLPLLTVYTNLGYTMDTFLNAKRIYENIISLPLHLDIDLDDIKYISITLINLINNKLNIFRN